MCVPTHIDRRARVARVMSGLVDQQCEIHVRQVEKGDPGDTVTVTFVGCHISIPNALRRIMMSSITTMAFDGIEVMENRSVMNTNMLTQRIQQIPLQSEMAQTFTRADKCSCVNSHCHRCAVPFAFDVKSVAGTTTMTQADLVPMDNANEEEEERKSKRSKPCRVDVVAVEEPIRIHRLAAGNKVSGRAFARAGTQSMHSKWQAVSTVGFETPVHLELSTEIEDLGKTQLVKCCPKKLFLLDEKTKKLSLRPGAQDNCIKCLECQKVLDPVTKQPVVKYRELNSPQKLTIESIGQLTAEDVFLQSLDALQMRVRECIAALEGSTGR